MFQEMFSFVLLLLVLPSNSLQTGSARNTGGERNKWEKVSFNIAKTPRTNAGAALWKNGEPRSTTCKFRSFRRFMRSGASSAPEPAQQLHYTDSLYLPFAEYAWNKLLSLSERIQLTENNVVPTELQRNSAPAIGFPPNCTVNIHIRGLAFDNAPDATTSISAIKYARYALLDTIGLIDPQHSQTTILPGIHVLNLVIFPNKEFDLPIFGADVVSLPGGRHLVAIDFQPVRIASPTEPTKGALSLSEEHMSQLKSLHEKYSQILEWGGDIPEPAQRFFSPYALWTRLNGTDAVNILQTTIFECFQDYLDLYVELLESKDTLTCDDEVRGAIVSGHRDYLAYRSANDPARPLLKRLYGEEWSERLITQVLFRE